MPNTGQPSRGCRTCKKRRIKCDEGRPECMRCSRSTRRCGGYEHDGLVIMIDQTQKTIDRATQQKWQECTRRNLQAPQEAKSTRSLQAVIQDASNSTGARVLVFLLSNMSLSISAQDALPRYLANPTASKPSKLTSPSSVLDITIHALVLCASWKIGDRANLRGQALDQYSVAIKAIETNLRDVQSARSDQVLLSVKLLELFECLCSDDPSNHAWARHASGSVSLVKWRGKYNFSTPLARSLFHSVRTTMVMTCIHYSECVPPYRDGISWGTPIMPDKDSASELIELAIDVAALKAQSKRLFGKYDITEMELGMLLVRARRIDRTLVAWLEGLSPEWQPHIVTMSPKMTPEATQKKAWKGKIQLYRSIWSGTHCILLYVLRIHVNAVLLRCLRATKADPGSERKCLERLEDLADNVCACIAPGIEAIEIIEDLPTGFDSNTSGGGAIYTKMWFLSTVLRLETISEEQRGWIRDRMVLISDRFGMNQARHLSTWPTSLMSQKCDEPDGVNQRRLFLAGLGCALRKPAQVLSLA